MRVFACMATTIDGKIGPANVDTFVAIGSPYDMENLIALRDEADGILFGASTFRTWPKVHRGNLVGHNPHHFIMSRRLNFDFSTALFQDPEVPITLFAGKDNQLLPDNLREHVDLVKIPEQQGQIQAILTEVSARGVRSLMIEGGGHILRLFIEAQVLQELFLTVVPSVIGDPKAPALLGGIALTHPPKIEVLSSRQIKNEVFMHLAFHYL